MPKFKIGDRVRSNAKCSIQIEGIVVEGPYGAETGSCFPDDIVWSYWGRNTGTPTYLNEEMCDLVSQKKIVRNLPEWW